MLTISHNIYGDPAKVLTVKEDRSPELLPDQVRICVSLVSVHPGDLLGIQGSPAFGPQQPIGPAGRIPGFEGAGVVTEVGRDVDPSLGISPGQRVAFFPVVSAWAEEVIAAPSSLVLIPDDVSDEIAAQALINTVTAQIVVDAAMDALSCDPKDAVAIQSAAGSAVGRLVSRRLMDHGVSVVRTVRSGHGAETLSLTLPGAPVIATSDPDWKDQVRAVLGDRTAAVAIDSVGGSSITDLAELIADGSTIINFGSLSGEASDLRTFPPRSLSLRGVVMSSWFSRTEQQRAEDVTLAFELARDTRRLFDVDRIMPAQDIAQAAEAIARPGRTGAVLLRF